MRDEGQWVLSDSQTLSRTMPPCARPPPPLGRGARQHPRPGPVQVEHDRFERVVTTDTLGVGKPDPSVFLHACELAGVAPEAAPSLDAAADGDAPAEHAEHSPITAWSLLILEVLAGIAIGIGLFWGFTELWRWNVYFALVLAVLVIFGIVSFTHAVRHSRDLFTTLLALGVGLIVTIGPLVLLAT